VKTKRIKPGKAAVYVFAAFWAVITIFPLFITFLCSVKDNAGITLGMFTWPKEFIWSNYVQAFKSAHILQALGNSLFFAASSTILTIVFGILAAYVLSRKKFKGRNIIYTAFLIGVMVPVHCTIIPISSMATTVHGKNQSWYLILVYTAFALSQAVFLFTGYLDSVSRELDEAATIDGCNDFQILFRVLLPVCTPIISTEAILAFVAGYGELIFGMVLMSDQNKYTVARAMLTFTGGYKVSLGPIFACIIVAVIPMIVIYIAFHEKVQSGMLSGAIKG
jgi:raffinose/stachyose/melibiose transport system permease protein